LNPENNLQCAKTSALDVGISERTQTDVWQAAELVFNRLLLMH